MGRARDWVVRTSPRTIPPLPHPFPPGDPPHFFFLPTVVWFCDDGRRTHLVWRHGSRGGAIGKTKAKRPRRGAVLSFVSTSCFNVIDPLAAIHAPPSPPDCGGGFNDDAWRARIASLQKRTTSHCWLHPPTTTTQPIGITPGFGPAPAVAVASQGWRPNDHQAILGSLQVYLKLRSSGPITEFCYICPASFWLQTNFCWAKAYTNLRYSSTPITRTVSACAPAAMSSRDEWFSTN